MLWWCPCYSCVCVCVVGSVFLFDMGGSLFVAVVPFVCSADVVDVCDVGVGGFMVGAPGRSCFVFFFRFVSFWARLCSTSSLPPLM